MTQTRTCLETSNANRYITRLCKHWGHRFTVEYDERRGFIDFGGSTCEMLAEGDALNIVVTAPGDQLDTLEEVVVDHLQRMAPKGETVSCTWNRASTGKAEA